MSDEAPPSLDESDVRPERRFLLFQMDFASKALEERMLPRWVGTAGRPEIPVAVSDYSDYDNPRSTIYWRDRLQEGWKGRYEKEFKGFAADLFGLINAGTLKLRSTPNTTSSKNDPYIDLSPYVRSISGYSVSLSDLSNTIQLSIARPDLTGQAIPIAGPELNGLLGMFNGILPRENDILMVLVKYPGKEFSLEYLGFVTKIEQGASYGQVDRYEISVDGISKITKISDIIRQQAVANNLFLPNIEVNRNSEVSVFADQFNDKDIRAIFEGIIESVLSIGPSDSVKAPSQTIPYTRTYAFDPKPFVPQIVTAKDGSKSVEFEGSGFQHNFFALLTVFLMTLEKPTNTALFPQRNAASPGAADYYALVKSLRTKAGGEVGGIPDSDVAVILSPTDRAFLDHGDNAAFNLMVARGFELFYPHMAKAEEILGEIRNTAFYDVFESRNGKIICRPSRYNKIENSLGEGVRASAESATAEGGLDIPSMFMQTESMGLDNKKVVNWEFNPGADFFIRKAELAEIPSRSFDDSALDSRVDVQLTLPMVGSQGFPAASYTDPDVLLRFGLKTRSPMSNPNALNASAPIIFAPLALALSNAPSRPLSLVVKDTRQFRVGKLYYIEAVDCVGYLAEETLLRAYGGLSKRQLSFTMVRRVVRRPLAEILAKDKNNSYNEALNMGMCYMDDPPDSGVIAASDAGLLLNFGDVKNLKGLMTQKGLKLAKDLQRLTTGAGQASVVMFRYIPSILDIEMEVEADPSLAARDSNVEAAVRGLESASRSASDQRNLAGVIGGSLALTFGFTKPENQQFYEEGGAQEFIIPFIETSNGQFSENTAQVEPTPGHPEFRQVTANPASMNPAAPLIPAGALNYGPADGTINTFKWFEAGSRPLSQIFWCKTPFSARAIVEDSQNIRTSQALANKLASADIAMKFLPPSDGQILPNFIGIPQLYYFDGASFFLFAPPSLGSDELTPSEFFGDRQAAGFGALNDIIPRIENGPQCLAININDLSEFANLINPSYRVKGSSGIFRLPFGHFMIPPVAGTSFDPKTARFVRAQSKRNKLLGGSFSIVLGPLPDQVFIAPADQDSELVLEDGSGTTFSASPVPFSPGLGGAFSASVPGKRLFFLTPYAEPTIERLLQFPMPVDVGGQVSQERLQALKKDLASQPGGSGVFTNNNERVAGNGINLSPDYLAAASRSDLETFPKRPGGAAIGSLHPGGIWGRFESGLLAGASSISGFKNSASVIPAPDALKVALEYPNGVRGADRLCLVYILRLVGAKDAGGDLTDNRTYASSLTAVTGALS